MKLTIATLITSVSVCNIALNMQVQKIAVMLNETNKLNFLQIFIAFFVGTLSMFFMFFLYKNPEVNLSRGIAWMGAISIIGASLYGYIIRKNILDFEEYVLISCLVVLFFYRIVIKKY